MKRWYRLQLASGDWVDGELVIDPRGRRVFYLQIMGDGRKFKAMIVLPDDAKLEEQGDRE